MSLNVLAQVRPDEPNSICRSPFPIQMTPLRCKSIMSFFFEAQCLFAEAGWIAFARFGDFKNSLRDDLSHRRSHAEIGKRPAGAVKSLTRRKVVSASNETS